jgi:hypothetical protein
VSSSGGDAAATSSNLTSTGDGNVDADGGSALKCPPPDAGAPPLTALPTCDFTTGGLGWVCPYVDSNGCLGEVACGIGEANPQWRYGGLPADGSVCKQPGQICTYQGPGSSHSASFYTDWYLVSCSASGVWKTVESCNSPTRSSCLDAGRD